MLVILQVIIEEDQGYQMHHSSWNELPPVWRKRQSLQSKIRDSQCICSNGTWQQ